ncbi:YgdI/YgdR family lipoprotein [Solidesulfovibrio carbinolicus]|uniref:DUF5050 domain-containing protein n=1 Tax=Solidesulfovibrio carbinolicus TaxID=296842 RepID=A0A4V0YQV6_9BACT|nr:hypothetical protein [Solidesulfovibrio carbinolicus]QAZ67632.1 hypothetical protein C3Y92_10500 [Solidesulfovibrio carbinolicus]
MRRLTLLFCLVLAAVSFGCAHTYQVETMDHKTFYASPPLVMDAERGVYYMWINGKRQVIPMDQVYRIDSSAQICYQNGLTDTYTCYDNLYYF